MLLHTSISKGYVYACILFYQNLIALGAEDRTMTISNAEGDTLNTVYELIS